MREDWQKHGGITCGTATTPVALEGLCRLGLADEAAAFIRNREFPSIGYMAESGATAVWERWDGIRNGRFHPHAMNAFDHIGLATVGEWILTSLAGIAPEENGYDVIRFQPVLDREIGGMRAALKTIHGQVEFEWSFEEDDVRLKAMVPCGAVGRLVLPNGLGEIRSVSDNKEIAGLSTADGETVISLEAGQHEFMVRTK